MNFNRIIRESLKCVLACVLVLIAVAIRNVFLPALQETPYIVFFPIIIILALYGGFWQGVFVTFLSTIVASFSSISGGRIQFDMPGHWTGVVVFLAGNIVISGVCAQLRQVQQKIKIEARKLLESELKYRGLFESAKDGILILDFETGLIVDINPFLIELIGCSRKDFLKKYIWDIGIFKDIIASKNAFLELQEKGYIRYEDLPLNMQGGRKIDVEFISNVYLVNGKKVIQCNIRDITERRRVEEELLRSREDFKCAQAVGNIGNWRLNIQRNELFWSDENYRIFGIPKGTPLTYETFLSTVHPDDRDYVDKKWKAGMAGQGYDIEHRIVADGIVKWVRENAFMEFDKNSILLAGFGITQDITTRKQAEEALRRSKEEWEETFNVVPDLIAILDDECRIVRVNKAMADRLGVRPEEYIGLKCYESVHGLSCPIEICPHAMTCSDGKEHVSEIHEPRLGGDFLVSTSPRFDEKGKLIGSVHVARDITERKKAEEVLKRNKKFLESLVYEKAHELIDAQKEIDKAKRLSDIGTLAATVAHELRNPLAAMRMAAYNIRMKRTNPDLDKHITNIEKKIIESDQIINNLLFYSRLKLSSYQKINIKDILEECMGHIRPQAEKNNVELCASVPDIPMEADPLQMSELFNNILNNAYDALISKKGKGKIEIIADIFNDKFLKIAISDNGIGINKESFKRMYEPFFTTKAKGTGLGLTVCYQIINLHKGTIDIKSEENKGTAVTIILPLNPQNM